MDYLDFEVDVSPGASGDYVVNVWSEFGEATGDFRLPFDTLALQNRLQALQIALLRSTSTTRGVATPEEETVERFGRELFGAMFEDGPILGRFQAARDGAEERDIGLRVKLRIDAPDLAALPWEYLFDPDRGDFLGLSIATPIVRYVALPRSIRPFATRPPLRILGLIASTPDLPNLDVGRERERLEVALREPMDRGQVELSWLSTGTWRELQTALLNGPWHIFHFIGHGGFDELRGEGFVYLPAETGRATRLSSTGLGRLLGDHDPMRLAVLNSCEGARGDAIDVFSSTAATVVQRGTPGVVAMQYQITDRAAIEFSRSFYTAIAGGVPIDAGLAVARKSISLEIPGTLEWGTPVLFMRAADGVLFEVAPGPMSPDTIERRTAPAPTAKAPRPHRAKPGAAGGTAGSSSGAAESRSKVSEPKLNAESIRTADPVGTTLAVAAAAPRRLVGALGDAVWRGGYFSTLLGAELGSIAAMLGVPALLESPIPKAILVTLWRDQAVDYSMFLDDHGIEIGLWLGIVGGAYLALRMFRVSDGHWTTFLLGIFAFLLIQNVKADPSQLLPIEWWDQRRDRVFQDVAVIVLLARGTTRLARSRRL